MQCPSCGHSNTDEAAFCSACGTRLALLCPQCDTPYTRGDAFCSACGHALEQHEAPTDRDPLLRYLPAELLEKLDTARQRRTMAGERRQVTMLFADIQGSTAAAEQLDPEEWADIVNGAFERLIRPVYRYEGTLARLMGDGVLAFFGAPIAHEDDPERAIRAGLGMLREVRPYAREVADRWGVEFDLRVGVNTGLVVVGEVGSDLRVEYTAMGDAVNVAARMEQVAEPGTLLVSEATHDLVAPLFEFEPIGAVDVKGKSEPVAAFRVTGTRDGRAAMRGLPDRTAPLVGRDSELAALRTVADEVMQGRGQIATVIGEAGVGKSRLVGALRDELAAEDCVVTWQDESDPNRLRWAEARCLSYNTAVAYAPFVDLFQRAFGIEPDDALGRERVAAAVDASGVEDVGRVTTYLCVLLGIDPGGAESSVVAGLPAPALQKRVFGAVVDYLRSCSDQTPVLLVFEDLHWADPVSLALLEELLAATDRSTLGVIALMRPYRDDTSWQFHEAAQRSFSHRYTPIQLEPLDSDAARVLLQELAAERLPADMAETVLQRAEGNPFFVEEIVRELVETGGSEDRAATIPTNVSGLLTSRIDRLDGASKLAIQLASVLGREFEFGELSALVDDVEATETALADLMRRDLVIEQSRLPEREYSFRHALIQETAYSTILLKERRALHAQVAEHLEGRSPDPQEMAHHLIESQQEARAVPYLLTAAEHAARTMNINEAIRLFDQALTWLPADDIESAVRAHDGLGAAYALIPDLSKAAATYQQMLEVGREQSQASVQVTALNRLGSTTAFLSGDIPRATEFLEDARRLAEQAGDEMGLAEYHMTSCMIATHLGDLEAAASHDAETARLGSSAGSERVRIGGLVQRAQSLVFGGRFEEGREALENARRAAAETDDPEVEFNLAGTATVLHLRDGDIDEAWELGRHATETASDIGSPAAAVLGLYTGMVATLRGNLEDALSHYANAARLGEELGQLFITAAAAASMVRLYADIGIDDPDVQRLRTTAVELTEQGAVMLSSIVHAELGWADLSQGDIDRARESFQTGMDGTSAAKLLELTSLLTGLAVTRIAAGDLTEAEPFLEQAAEFVDEKGLAFARPHIAMTRGALESAAGRLDDAERTLDEGVGLAEAMGELGIAWRLRAARAGVLNELGRADDAVSELTAARELVEEMASRFADPALSSAFSTSARKELDELAGARAG